MRDHDLILVEGRCIACARSVSAPIDELRSTGVFACVCGALTRAAPPRVEGRSLFRGWPGKAPA